MIRFQLQRLRKSRREISKKRPLEIQENSFDIEQVNNVFTFCVRDFLGTVPQQHMFSILVTYVNFKSRVGQFITRARCGVPHVTMSLTFALALRYTVPSVPLFPRHVMNYSDLRLSAWLHDSLSAPRLKEPCISSVLARLTLI